MQRAPSISRRRALALMTVPPLILYLPWLSRLPGGRLQVTDEGRVVGFLTSEAGRPLSTAFPYVPCEAQAWTYQFMAALMPTGWDGHL